MNLFVAVLPKSESEKYIVGLAGKYGLKSRVLLGDIIGFDANFYKFEGLKTRNEIDELVKNIVVNCNTEEEIFRVTGSNEKDKFELADFVIHATEED